MKAAFLTGIRQIEIKSVSSPKAPGPKEVLLKLAAVGVCGSDVHYFKEGRIGDQVVSYPYRVGHECSAWIEAVGSEVTGLKPGALVAVEPAISCGVCSQCLSGRANTCERLKFLGCPGEIEGCLAEYLLMPEECCFPVPERISPMEAALVEPFSIAIYAIRQSGNIQGKKIGILGCGPIGLSVLMSALREQAIAYVTEKIIPRLAKAGQAGAAWTGNPDQTDIVKEIKENEPAGLDVVFECCGQQDALDQAIDLLKPGGKLMFIGIPSQQIVHFPVNKMRRKEITIQNVRRQNGCVPTAIDFIAENSTRNFVTHQFPLEHSQQAFELVADYADGVMKAIIQISGKFE